MATTLDLDTLKGLRGNNVVDRNGDKIGSFEQLYVSRDTGEPEWAAVKTGLFGMNVNLVPLDGADRHGDDLQVHYDADLVKSAPDVDADREISEDEEQRLYSHYGQEYDRDDSYDRTDGTLAGEAGYGDDDHRSETTTRTDTHDADRDDRERHRDDTIARDLSGTETDSAMTRSEEELRVGTTQRERGHVRLRKYVETDTVTKTVPVEREVVRVETEPVTDANGDDAMDGPALSDEEAEVTLSEEEVVVEKRAVPKERVRLDKDVVTEEREVTEEVGREHIDVDDDAGLSDELGTDLTDEHRTDRAHDRERR